MGILALLSKCYQPTEKMLSKMKKLKRINLTLVYNRMHRGSTQKAVSVEVRFSCGSQRKYISTGVKVCTNQWNGTKIVRSKDADALNAQLNAFVSRAESVRDRMTEEGITDLSLIPTLFAGEEGKQVSFIDYCKKRAEERKVSEGTRKRYYVFIRFLSSFGKFTLFSDCNIRNIRYMDEFLHNQGKEQSTIQGYHKILKLFINDAVVDGYIDRNPYSVLPFKIPKGEKKYVECLNEEQFEAIKGLSLDSPHLIRVRDLFLFQCYTGLAYSDLMAFDYASCKEENGKVFYHAKRTKTDTDFVFQLLSPAIEILKKYDYVLPHISNMKYNDYLKAIGVMVGVPRLHTHMGRATAATLFLSKGMPINIVAKVLGHTTRYARTLSKDVRSAFDSLEGKL